MFQKELCSQLNVESIGIGVIDFFSCEKSLCFIVNRIVKIECVMCESDILKDG